MRSVKRKKIDLDTRFGAFDEKYVIDLTKDGILCMPVVGKNDFHHAHETTKTHTHEECIEVVYCRKGKLVYESEGKLYYFSPGKVFVSMPDQPHRMLAYPKGLATYYFLFRIPRGNFPLLKLPGREARWLRDALAGITRRIFDAPQRMPALFRELFEIHATIPKKSPERALRLRHVVMDLLLETVLASQAVEKETGKAGLETILDEIRRNPGARHSIDSLAERAFVSPSVLTTRFKEATGLPPHAFILHCRIEQAKERLAQGSDSVVSLASELGFPSSQHFAVQFKSATGLTPTAWRRQHSKTAKPPRI